MTQSLTTATVQTQRQETSLIQFLDMMTMPLEELNEKIKAEAEKNPVIELRETDSSYEEIASRASGRTPVMHDEANTPFFASDDDDKSDWFEKAVSEKENLTEHLIKELGCLELDDNVRATAETIISGLDEYGFTGPEPESLVPESEKPYVKDAVKAVQSLEPTGVGAKDWKEALMLQIREIEKDRSEVARYRDIIYKGLEYIQRGEEDRLARALRIGREDLDAMISVIKTLTPFPGLKYTSSYTSYAVPEIEILVRDGEIVIRMLSSGLLGIEIDPDLVKLKDELGDSRDREDRDARKFLRENITSAENLMKLIEMRKTTMEKLAVLLAKRQREFFFHGPLSLKALTMTETAEELGVNVSTISKMGKDKYILTPWGTYPLRFFFSTEVKSSVDEDVSKTAVILKIKEMIENNRGKKLSDQKIADALEEEGIHVARRTVNKYRKEIDRG